jgi:hypothetical protein
VSRTGRSRTHGAGSWGGTRGRVRAGDLRAQADEMAALLDEAAPRARRRRRRRSTALPAAVAAFGALSVGGVGLALGLTPTGAEGQLPAAPSPVIADPGTELPTATSGDTPRTVDLDPAVAGADLIRPEERAADEDDAPDRPAPSSGPRATASPSSTTTTTTRPPRPTRSSTPRPTRPPRPTVTRSATPRSTTTAASSSASPRPVAERSALPTRSAGTDAPDTAPTASTRPDLDPDDRDTLSPDE